MLSPLQLFPESSMSQGLGTISMAQARWGEAGTGHLISWIQRRITRQNQEEIWLGTAQQHSEDRQKAGK